MRVSLLVRHLSSNRREHQIDPRARLFLLVAGTGAAVGVISINVFFESLRWAPPPLPPPTEQTSSPKSS